jgi:hypothetical protein
MMKIGQKKWAEKDDGISEFEFGQKGRGKGGNM